MSSNIKRRLSKSASPCSHCDDPCSSTVDNPSIHSVGSFVKISWPFFFFFLLVGRVFLCWRMLSDVDLDLSLSFPILLPPLSPHHVTHREKREDVEIQSNSFIAGLSNRFISLMRLRLHPPTDRFFPPTLHVYTNKQQLNIKKKKKDRGQNKKS